MCTTLGKRPRNQLALQHGALQSFTGFWVLQAFMTIRLNIAQICISWSYYSNFTLLFLGWPAQRRCYTEPLQGSSTLQLCSSSGATYLPFSPCISQLLTCGYHSPRAMNQSPTLCTRTGLSVIKLIPGDEVVPLH